MKSTAISVMTVVGAVYAGSAMAQTPNDANNYKGDRLSSPVKLNGYRTTPDGNGEEKVCIPARTTLRGLGTTPAGTNGKSEAFVNVRVTSDAKCADEQDNLPKDEIIRIKQTELEASGYSRYGLTYGALVVPYKYHFEGSRSFEGNSTVGPYFGYRFDRNGYGFGVKAIAFVGGSAIKVNRVDANGNSKDETLAGFSYGVGLIGEVKSEFQLGVVFGWDRVSDGSDYEDNGKLWGAVALGFSFAN